MCKRPHRPAGLHHWVGALVATGGLLAAAVGCTATSHRAPFSAGTGNLTVACEGFRNDRGTAIVSVFASTQGFPEEITASAATQSLPIVAGKAQTVFPALPFGEYAVSVLHDEDGDGQMARGLLGAPREGFGFSGHPDYRFGPPRFDEVSVLLLAPQRDLTIVMRYETARRQHQDEGRTSGARRPQE